MKRRIPSISRHSLPAFALVLGFVAAPLSVHANSVRQVSPALCTDMKAHHAMRPDAPVGCERLVLVRFAYIGFEGQEHGDGELVVLDALADQVAAIFAELKGRRFPIAQARLMNAYNGDDDASMEANNTSAFNDRNVVGSNAMSTHAYGAAIDINPIQNPSYDRVNGVRVLVPKAGAPYAKRAPLRPGMAESVIQIFAAHGFTVWGGRFRDADYQHFAISRTLVRKLVRLPPAEARAMFNTFALEHGSQR
jgi:hypothetical protein